MSTQRETLTSRRDKLLATMNAAGRWTPEQYAEVQDLSQRISGLPEDEPQLELTPEPKPELKPLKKGR